MTETQRDYLADLANRKGVRLENTDEVSVSWASNKIEELKAMPDKAFEPMSDKEVEKFRQLVAKTITELHKWTFAE